MKKTLSFILVCALLVSAFALTAFADTIINNVDTFDPTTDASQNVNVTVNSVSHKYAIDVTYTVPTYTIPGITWNVTSLKYDVNGDLTSFDADVTIAVDNRSDKPVFSTLDVVDALADDGITFDCKVPTTTTEGTNDAAKVGQYQATATINPATDADTNVTGNAGTKRTVTYAIDVNADAVTAGLKYEYSAYMDGGTDGKQITVGSYTITVKTA